MGICWGSASDCTLWEQGRDSSNYKADPDISGIGVRTSPPLSVLCTYHWGLTSLLQRSLCLLPSQAFSI